MRSVIPTARVPRLGLLMGLCMVGAVLLSQLGPATSTSRAEGLSLSEGQACEGLTAQACCAQVLDTQVFRAGGSQPEKRTRVVHELICKAEAKRLPKHGCRQVLVSRGVATAEATSLCRPTGVAKLCSEEPRCRDCRRELSSMGYVGSVDGVCYAASWSREPKKPYPIILTR